MLAVEDMLNRPSFQEAEVLAGTNGLHKKVKWVHVVEINNFGHLLHGQEVILTTGVNWINDEEKSVYFLEQLLEKETSALCVELVEHSKTLPTDMLNIAEKHNLPVIGFNKEVKFIDITMDLHEIILNYQQHSWWKLDNLYKKLHNSLVSNYPIGDFLKLLHQATNKQMLLSQNKDQYRFFPSPSKRKQSEWIEQIQQDTNSYNAYPIHLLDQPIAYLYILEKQNNISLFDEEAAKRCSEFLEQYFWKHYQTKEREQIKQNEWLLDALDGPLSRKQITEKIYESSPTTTFNDAIVGVLSDKHSLYEEENDSFMTETFMFFRSILENNGFHLFTTKGNVQNGYVLLIINQQENDSCYERLNYSLQQVYASNNYHHIQGISFGKIISDYESLYQSYQTALTTLNYQLKHDILTEPFYDNLGVYRLVNQVENTNELERMIKHYVGPLMSYDQRNGTELLKTFQIYLKNLGSKNDTSRELYIVRQTLYHRLDRIKELLGEDFMSPENRIMAELSVYMLTYLDIEEQALVEK
ncbi:hypothetical protein GCM10008983_00790 [Lentibacillus halophilus]|uniref:Purine catabolism regulatory protein n=1 Tax=Lentibacillus halophilus TaxID=295065 RepID=A0ABP3IV88_9BACI